MRNRQVTGWPELWLRRARSSFGWCTWSNGVFGLVFVTLSVGSSCGLCSSRETSLSLVCSFADQPQLGNHCLTSSSFPPRLLFGWFGSLLTWVADADVVGVVIVSRSTRLGLGRLTLCWPLFSGVGFTSGIDLSLPMHQPVLSRICCDLTWHEYSVKHLLLQVF